MDLLASLSVKHGRRIPPDRMERLRDHHEVWNRAPVLCLRSVEGWIVLKCRGHSRRGEIRQLMHRLAYILNRHPNHLALGIGGRWRQTWHLIVRTLEER